MKTMTKPMRRMINTAIVYFALAMCAGIFYREFTKAFAYTGPTPLKAVHAHLLILGMLLFLLLALFCQNNPQLTDCNSFACFYVIYNISLPIMALCLLTRGVLAVEHATPNRIVDATISGIAGLSHIGLAVALILLFVAIKRRMPVESSDQQDCTAHRS